MPPPAGRVRQPCLREDAIDETPHRWIVIHDENCRGLAFPQPLYYSTRSAWGKQLPIFRFDRTSLARPGHEMTRAIP